MDEFWRNHVPAFGNWDCNDDLPFTQCFESARQAGLIRYEDRDLYVAGDLYENNVVTPAMIVVPRRKKGKNAVKEWKKEDEWVVSEYDFHLEDYKVKEIPKPKPKAPPPPPPKPVDEDLYKISPHLLYAKSNKKKNRGFFSCCLVPSCDK